MKKSNQFILIILGMLHFCGCSSLPKRNRNASPSATFEIKNDPSIVFGKLDNGFRYALMKNDYPEKRIVTALNFDVGSAMEEDQERGLAHFLEHMSARGSKHFPNGKIVEHMQKLGIAFGLDLNAYTSFFNTCYELDLPNDEPETVDSAFLAFRDFCDGLSLLENDVNQERGVILSEKRDRTNVFQRLSKETLKFQLKGTILTQRFPIGKAKVIQCASASDLRHFYEKWYAPEKTFFVAVGNVDIQKFEEQIRKTFQDLPSKIAPEVQIGNLEAQKKKNFYFSDPDLSTTTVDISTLFPDLFSNDNYEARRYYTMIAWASNILQERLRDKKFENPSLFLGYEVSFAQNFSKTKHSIFDLNIICKHENWPQCLSLLEQEMRKICQYGISAEELQRQKEVSLNRAESNMLSAKTRYSSGIVEGLIGCYHMNQIFTSPEDEYELIKVLNGDITSEDCRQALCRIWKNLSISVITNQPIDDAQQTIESIFNQSEVVPVSSNDKEILGQFAYEHFETPYREIVQRNHIEDLDITQITLANGITVNLKPTDFEQNQIQFTLMVGHGLLTEYPQSQPGIFLATGLSFLSSGLQKNSWKELGKFIASKCLQIYFYIDEYGFNFSGMCDKKNLLLELQLVTAYLSDPGFEERAIFEAREALKPIYQNREKSPGSVMADQYRKFITKNDFISGLPDEQSVFSVTMEDIKKLLLPVFQNEAIELTIMGDFDLEMAIQNIQDTLGALPQRSPSQNTVADRNIFNFPKETAEKSFFFTGDEKRTLSLLTFLTDDENNTEDNRYLVTLCSIIRDRLRSKVRKEQGKAYSPSANHNATPFKSFGLLQITLSLDPELTYDTKKETLAIIEDLKTNPVSQEELDRIKLPILNVVRDNFRNNSFWLSYIMHAHRRPQFLERLRTMRSFYENITAQDLLKTAQKYLNNPIHTTIAKQPSIQDSKNRDQNREKKD